MISQAAVQSLTWRPQASASYPTRTPCLPGEIGEFGEIFRRAIGVVDGVFSNGRAKTEQAGAEVTRQFELAAGAIKIALTRGRRRSLEIAQRLQRHEFQPKVGGDPARVARRTAIEGQIVLEQFDRAEASLGDRRQLRLQVAAEADRRDRPLIHALSAPKLWRLLLRARFAESNRRGALGNGARPVKKAPHRLAKAKPCFLNLIFASFDRQVASGGARLKTAPERSFPSS